MKVKHLYISSGHNFFGHYGKPPGENKIQSVDEVQCVAGRGLEGDRFFDHKDNYKGQVTFFSAEVYEALCNGLSIFDKDPTLLRRNVVTEGVDLNTLIGKEFELQGIKFLGTEECSPCFWMNDAFGAGAEDFLKGQGGLRCRILSDGALKVDA